jgi:hypothetical protein
MVPRGIKVKHGVKSMTFWIEFQYQIKWQPNRLIIKITNEFFDFISKWWEPTPLNIFFGRLHWLVDDGESLIAYFFEPRFLGIVVGA